MLQSLRSRRNRKGFTLAELLIVVAIIAVLVAIAVPLFVGALDDAKKNTENANKRAVRVAAVYYILTHTNDTNLYASGELKDTYEATGKLDKAGNITEITVKSAESVTESYSEAGDVITVVVEVKKTDVKSVAGT